LNQIHLKYEVRCPIHGFIEFNDWERAVIDTPEFQRLRRIRQLAFTEFIYPGANQQLLFCRPAMPQSLASSLKE